MKYFFDNAVSFRLADMLRALGVDAIALRREYAEDTKDIELFENFVVVVSSSYLRIPARGQGSRKLEP